MLIENVILDGARLVLCITNYIVGAFGLKLEKIINYNLKKITNWCKLGDQTIKTSPRLSIYDQTQSSSEN